MQKTKKKPAQKKKTQKKEVDWDEWERQARQRSAWGEYTQTMYAINRREEDFKIVHGTNEERDEILKRREKQSPIMYIG